MIQWPLRFHAGLYIVMSLAMSRSQEREAEAIASAKVRAWFTVKATIKLRDGTKLHLKEAMSSHRLKDDSNEVFKTHLGRCG